MIQGRIEGEETNKKGEPEHGPSNGRLDQAESIHASFVYGAQIDVIMYYYILYCYEHLKQKEYYCSVLRSDICCKRASDMAYLYENEYFGNTLRGLSNCMAR